MVRGDAVVGDEGGGGGRGEGANRGSEIGEEARRDADVVGDGGGGGEDEGDGDGLHSGDCNGWVENSEGCPYGKEPLGVAKNPGGVAC